MDLTTIYGQGKTSFYAFFMHFKAFFSPFLEIFGTNKHDKIGEKITFFFFFFYLEWAGLGGGGYSVIFLPNLESFPLNWNVFANWEFFRKLLNWKKFWYQKPDPVLHL